MSHTRITAGFTADQPAQHGTAAGVPPSKRSGFLRYTLLGLGLVGAIALTEKVKPVQSVSNLFRGAKTGIEDRLSTDPAEASEKYLQRISKATDEELEANMPGIVTSLSGVYDKLGPDRTARLLVAYIGNDGKLQPLANELGNHMTIDKLAMFNYNTTAALEQAQKKEYELVFVKQLSDQDKIEGLVTRYTELPKLKQFSVILPLTGQLTEITPAVQYLNKNVFHRNNGQDGNVPQNQDSKATQPSSSSTYQTVR